MFSKAKKKQADSEDTPIAPVKADNNTVKNQSSSSAGNKSNSKRSSNMKSPGVPSLISTDVTLEGNLVSSGEVQFDGNITGNIRAGSLIIGEKATVKGEVACEAVTVRGRVEGMVRARNVALASTAHIQGDIMHSSLSVEPGAHFDGNCRHSEDPLADDATKAFDRPASGGRPNSSAPRPVPSAVQEDDTPSVNATAPARDLDNTHAHSDFAAPTAPSGMEKSIQAATGTTPVPGHAGASSFLAKNRSPLR